jgi:signal transduction histidine kinase
MPGDVVRTHASSASTTPRFTIVRDRVGANRVLRELLVLFLGVIIPSLFVYLDHDIRRTSGAVRRGVEIRDVVAVAVFVPLLLFRRRWPVRVVGTGAVFAAAILATSPGKTVALPSLALLLFTMATLRPRRSVLLVGGCVVATVFAAVCFRLGTRWFTADNFGIVAWLLLALAAGDAVRSGRQYVDSLKDSALQSEASREAETKRRVIEERLRIARELHDVVAHQMAIVNVQAGVASHLIEENPTAAKDALRIVREAGRSVLNELGDLLSVLRSTDGTEDDLLDPNLANPERPQPTIRELDALVTSFRLAGIAVEHKTSGHCPVVPDMIQLTVYRIIEEALTNVHKHGDGHANLQVDFQPTGIHLTVTNRSTPIDTSLPDIEQGRKTRIGHGLVGIRERVAAVHGTAAIGPTPGAFFTVDVTIPMKRDNHT